MTRVVLTLIAGLAATVVTPFAQPKVPKIPICAGMTIVTAVNDATGDYESIKTIESVTDKELRIKYSTQKMDYGDMFSTSSAPPKLKSYLTRRTVLREDMRTSRAYLQEFAEVIPETVPGMTALGTSTVVLEDLKKKGEAEFGISHWSFAVPPGLDPNDSQSIYHKQMKVISKIQPPSPVMLPVMINGVQAELPAIHTHGDFYSYISEFWFLDQADNPLTLKFRIGIGEKKALSPEDVEKCKTDTKLLGYPPQHCLRPGEERQQHPRPGQDQLPLRGGDAAGWGRAGAAPAAAAAADSAQARAGAQEQALVLRRTVRCRSRRHSRHRRDAWRSRTSSSASTAMRSGTSRIGDSPRSRRSSIVTPTGR